MFAERVLAEEPVGSRTGEGRSRSKKLFQEQSGPGLIPRAGWSVVGTTLCPHLRPEARFIPRESVIDHGTPQGEKHTLSGSSR